MELGWGHYLENYVTIPVVNKAIGGHSARSFSNEGRFAEIEELLSSGDIGIGGSFVDHFQAVGNMYNILGSAKTNALYPQDHTHTSPEGADCPRRRLPRRLGWTLTGRLP